MKNITYKHTRTGETVIYTAPVLGLERSKVWQRVEGPVYGRMRKAALVKLCEDRGLDVTGLVPVLAERLDAYDAEHGTPQVEE